MNWDALGAIGEIMGSVLVLATLIYVAIQTRNISKQSRAEARYTFVEAMGQVNMAVAQDKELASVWARGLNRIEDLDEDERMQFFMLVGQYANLWSVMHQLHEEDLLPPTQWHIVKTDLLSIMGSRGGRYFWAHGGNSAFDSSFTVFVDKALESDAQPYDMAKMALINDD